MMELLKKNRTVIGFVAVAALGLYSYMTYYSPSGEPLLSTAEETAPVSQELLAVLGSVYSIKLDPAIFTDPVFLSLSDFGTVIPQENIGRRNPFEPVGGASGALPAQ